MKNENLARAKTSRNDEFYTQLEDIEAEMAYYVGQFRDKVVYCNCDDPAWSKFWKYFDDNFDELGLRGLVSTYHVTGGVAYKSEIRRDGSTGMKSRSVKTVLESNGDFRSSDCVDILKSCDIVVGNPPFSLFREYVAQLVDYDKKFLIIGNKNALTYKEIFPLIRDNKVWTGVRGFAGGMWFYSESEGKTEKFVDGRRLVNVPSIWFTNMEHSKRHLPLDLTCNYVGNEDVYPRYDNYDAINVSKVVDIPQDYDGVMGVPITFLDKYCPEQFEIIGVTESEGCGLSAGLFHAGSKVKQPLVHGQRVYKRLFIRRRR